MEKIRFSCYDLFKNFIMALLSIISVMPYELSADPCNNYTVLDDSRRSINYYSSKPMCDVYDLWVGWYRLYLNGQSAQMPETCVAVNMCGTEYPLWLSGGHPKPEDGVVTRDVCGHGGYYCCFYQSFPIRVKACTGGYYVYEFVTPTKCNMAYCADVSSVNFSNTMINSTDPCKNYTVLNDSRRSTNYNFSSTMCDRDVSWVGWYRLYLDGQSTQMPETCVAVNRCGTNIPLWLRGRHPYPEDGVVTRNVCGHSYDFCCFFQSYPIKVKACTGGYYVYELVRPTECNSAYCADSDPCSNYLVLDDPRRSTSYPNTSIFDASVIWVGWYRLYLNNQSAQMPESCVAVNRCGNQIPLWLRGGHPKPEDGVVTRDVCGHSDNYCCFFKSYPIRVKACTGGYYVYEFVSPTILDSAYCAEVSKINKTTPTGLNITQLTNPSDDQQRDLLNVFVIVGLAFTSLALLTFAFCRWKPGVNNVARINLCISLLSAHLLFLLTQQFINLIKPYKELCAVISGVLHFFFLSYFVWMFIEAVLLFICVKNLSQISSRWRAMLSSRFLIVIGYVIPFIIVRVSVGLLSEGYGSEQCWIKVERGFIWSFLGPVCFILAINTILFISIIISLHLTLKKLNTEVSHMRQTKITVFKTLAQFVIFGGPWILGPFIDSKVVKILFLILNSQQGTFIFLVYCVLNNEVRQQYVKWLRNLFSGLKPRTIKSGSNNTAD